MSSIADTQVFESTLEHFDQDKYKRSLSLDPQYNPLSTPVQRIQWLRDEDQGVYSVSSVDSTIQIRNPKEAFRIHKASLWQKKQEEEKAGALKGVLGVVTAIVAVVLNSVYFKNAVAVNRIALVGVVVSAIFAGMKEYAATQADKEVTSWNRSPVQELANQRAEAQKGGFPYAYSNNLKLEEPGSAHGILHPLEVKTMYENYFPGFCKELLSRDESRDQGREAWMHSFLHMNPLSSKLMIYGWGEIPDRMKAVSDKFIHFSSHMDAVRSSVSDLKKQVNDNANKLIASYEEQRKTALQPWVEKKTTELNHALSVRDAALKENSQDAEATFKAMKDLCENDYAQNTRSINQSFDQKIEGVKKGRDESLKSLDGTQTEQLLKRYTEARALLTEAEAAFKG